MLAAPCVWCGCGSDAGAFHAAITSHSYPGRLADRYNSASYAYPLDVATCYYGPHFMTASVFTIISGQLIDGGLHEKWLLSGAGIALGVGLLLLPHVMLQRQHRGSQGVANPVMASLSGSFRGISIGLREPVRLSVLGKYFGREHLAEITGSTRMYHMLGIAVGPLIITGLCCIDIVSLLPLH